MEDQKDVENVENVENRIQKVEKKRKRKRKMKDALRNVEGIHYYLWVEEEINEEEKARIKVRIKEYNEKGIRKAWTVEVNLIIKSRKRISLLKV
jgi:hypothetical protein